MFIRSNRYEAVLYLLHSGISGGDNTCVCCDNWSAPHHQATATAHKHVALEAYSCLRHLFCGLFYRPGLVVRELRQYRHPPFLPAAYTRVQLPKGFDTNDTGCHWKRMQVLRHRPHSGIRLMQRRLHSGAGTALWLNSRGATW